MIWDDIAFRYVTTLILMALDIVSGVVKCFTKNEKFSSAKMATGLYKKTGTLCILFLADVLKIISARYLQTDIDIALYVYLYVVLMESLSMAENWATDDIVQIIKNLFKKG